MHLTCNQDIVGSIPTGNSNNMKKVSKSNKESNKTVSEELLDSARKALYKLKDYLDNIDFTDEDNTEKKATTMMIILEKMGKSFETLAILEKKVQAEEDLKGKARGNVRVGLFEDGDI
jgi:ribosomal protein RSM22 (predicted rRNA methylase)